VTNELVHQRIKFLCEHGVLSDPIEELRNDLRRLTWAVTGLAVSVVAGAIVLIA
jgi:hypothetical protein